MAWAGWGLAGLVAVLLLSLAFQLSTSHLQGDAAPREVWLLDPSESVVEEITGEDASEAALLTIYAPISAQVIVKGLNVNVERELVVPESGVLKVPLPPGLYEVSVTASGRVLYLDRVKLEPGARRSIAVAPGPTPTQVETSVEPVEEVTVTIQTPQASETATGLVEESKTIVLPGFEYVITVISTVFTHDTISLIAAAAILAVVAVVLYSYVQEDQQDKENNTRDVQTRGLKAFVGVSSLIGARIGSFSAEPRCEGSFKASLNSLMAPRGFEGEWSCCRLGCGGWGCAYKCSRSGVRVVFKVPRGFEALFEGGVPPTVSQGLLEKIYREAEAVSSLRHPHILRLLGVSRSAPILVYEYADNGTLEMQVHRGWRPGVREVLLLGAQLADALRYIHGRGMVHGDIKPGNVFIVDGIVKLGDFSSLSRLASTATGHSVSFTPGWRAPEQVYSDLRRKAVERGMEHAVDVYQLGNLLLWLLTGENIDGEYAVDEVRAREVLRRVGDERLRRLLSAMIALDPEGRPSAAEVARELARLYRLYTSSNPTS